MIHRPIEPISKVFLALIEHLEDTFEDNSIAMNLVAEAYEEYDTVDDFVAYIQNITSYGCASGVLPELIYTDAIQRFFLEHYDCIAELVGEYEDEFGSIELGYDCATTLTYLAVEMVASRIENEVEDYLS